MIELRNEECVIEAAGDMKGPEGAEFFADIFFGVETLEEIGVQGRHVFAGGGAFLEFVEGKTLPAVEVLTRRATDQ